MAELDYAFLAEFAKVENNQLTVVGASYTHVYTGSLPANHILYVAGRVRSTEGEEPPVLGIKFRSPAEGLEIGVDSSLTAEEARPYAGKIGLTFAVGLGVPLMTEGLYEVYVELDGVEVRRLAFDLALGEKKQ
ncbi:DUF6941 family protein [Arthrobacter bambusae]|uniref:Uncharacterized protein n=1 Tax=Arthrobacter bambusae TaxID=1338426 RepID=A0AAW8DGF9_9MICC|nr:hypothetical protein [Arthrobacter bambusae]MDP9904546.1 hypothetical protein [Arthrobacter bambusae]MDQ0129361.1 hypothetical protein [Arthrobacter bambusae]MDQ0181026.1 hypothetical protein [Arthrobacter bambusae]